MNIIETKLVGNSKISIVENGGRFFTSEIAISGPFKGLGSFYGKTQGDPNDTGYSSVEELKEYSKSWNKKS